MSKRGFTLIEFAVASLAFAIAGGVAFYFLKQGLEARKVAASEAEMMKEQDQAIKAISTILDQVIRVDGPSKTANPSIVESVDSANFERLDVIINKHPHVMTKVQGLTSVSGGYQFTLYPNPVPQSGDSPEEVERKTTVSKIEDTVKNFLSQTQATIPVMFQSSGETNLLLITPPQSASSTIGINIAPLLSGSTFSRVQSAFANEMRVAMTAHVRIFVGDIQNGVGTLKVTEDFGSQSTTRDILTGVSSLKFLYAFDKFHRLGNQNMILPTGSLDKPDASDYRLPSCGGNPNCCPTVPNADLCVDQSDLASIRVVIKTNRKIDSAQEFVKNEHGTSLASGLMQFEKVHFVNPKNFAGRSSQWDSLQSLSCRNPNARCKPGCEDFFVGSDPSMPNWEGYGRHVVTANPSDYCLCGTSNRPSDPAAINFILPETAAGYDAVPFYHPPRTDPKTDPSNRILACSAHFTDYIWAFKNPYQYVFHNGLAWNVNDPVLGVPIRRLYRHNSADPAGTYTEATVGRVKYEFQKFDDLRDNYLAYGVSDPGSFWRSHILCRLGFDGISQNFRWAWSNSTGNDSNGNPVVNYIALTRDPANARLTRMTKRVARPWEEACLCETVDSEGWNGDWACNHFFSGGNPNLGPTQSEGTKDDSNCPETWTGEFVDQNSTALNIIPATPTDQRATQASAGVKKVYAVRSTAYPMGLSNPSLALMCECLQQRYPNTYVPISEGWAVSNYWDFRLPGSIAAGTAVDLTGYAPADQHDSSGAIQMNASANHSFPNFNSAVPMTATVFYRDEAPGTGGIKSLTNRCDAVYGGVMGRTTNPQYLDPTSKAEILQNFTTNCSSGVGYPLPYCSGGSLDPVKADQWSSFCYHAGMGYQEIGGGVISENSWSNGLYIQPGVHQIRKYITGVGPSGAVPAYCGGRPTQGQGGT